MAQKLNDVTPDIKPPDTENPDGSFLDKSKLYPGSPTLAGFANSTYSFFRKLMTVADIEYNGQVETTAQSQYYEAMESIIDTDIKAITEPLDSRISVNEGYISTLKEDVITNANNISTNASNISSNDSDITTLSGRIDSNDTDIANNASNISSNDSAINTLSGRIDDNDTDIANNAGNITTNSSAISINGNAISGNTTDISNNTTDISNNTTDISNNTIGINTNADAINNNSFAIAFNAGNIDDNVDAINTNAGNIATNAGNIVSNAGEIAANAGNITDLKNKVGQSLNIDDDVTFNSVRTDNVNIRQKLFTGNLDASGNLSRAHGLDWTKIVSVTALCQSDASASWLAPGNTNSVFAITVLFDSNNIEINAGDRYNSQPYRILVTYQN